MHRRDQRSGWVAYLGVSTPEQAERDLSLPAQRYAIESYAKAHGATIAREFIEEGYSGTDEHRRRFGACSKTRCEPVLEADPGEAEVIRDAYAMHLIERVELLDVRAMLVPKPGTAEL